MTTTKKKQLDLGPVQQTMLLPLVGRAEVARWMPGFYSDPKAEEILKKLDVDVRNVKRQMSKPGLFGITVRAIKLDKWLREYIYSHPGCKVVNVGAGLDTAFYRVDNGHINWYDIDLPDAMALRSKVFEEHPRVTRIAQSVFDLSWVENIGDYPDGLIIQIPGVLMYFKLEEVKAFFIAISAKLPGAHVIFDVTSHIARKLANRVVQRTGIQGTDMGWGITDARDMEKWSKHIKVVKQEPYFVDVPNWQMVPVWLRPVTTFMDSGQFIKMFHLKFMP